jgi:hypothetical protein
LKEVEEKYIPIIRKIQLSGETKYILEKFYGLFCQEKDNVRGTEFFSIMIDMIHLSGRYKEAVQLISTYLNQRSLDDISNNEYALNLYIRRTHHKMFYYTLSELQEDMEAILILIDDKKFIRQKCEILFKTEAKSMDYVVLAQAIDSIIEGKKDVIRFEYL